MKTFEAYTMCDNIKSNMFQKHMCRTKADDKDIKRAFVILLDCTKYL